MARSSMFKGIGKFGNPMAVLKYNVEAQDVLVGALAGLVGTGAVNFAIKKLNFTLPAALAPVRNLISTGLVGAAMYYGQKGSSRAKGHLIGALAAGTAITAWDYLKTNYAEHFSDVVELNYGGLLVNDPNYQMNGLIVNDPQRALSDANLAQLAAISMDNDEDYSDVEQLMIPN